MINRDSLGALIFLVFFTGYAIFAWQIPVLPFEELDAVNSSSIPKVYACFGILFSLLGVFSPLLKGVSKEAILSGLSWRSAGQTLVLLVLMWVYTSALEPLGFILSTMLFLASGFLIMGERRWRTVLLASVPVTLVFWFIMTQLLGIYLVPGELWS